MGPPLYRTALTVPQAMQGALKSRRCGCRCAPAYCSWCLHLTTPPLQPACVQMVADGRLEEARAACAEQQVRPCQRQSGDAAVQSLRCFRAGEQHGCKPQGLPWLARRGPIAAPEHRPASCTPALPRRMRRWRSCATSPPSAPSTLRCGSSSARCPFPRRVSTGGGRLLLLGSAGRQQAFRTAGCFFKHEARSSHLPPFARHLA